ncbi:protein-disulfide reductase DsbD family protein [Novipirellula caenicola]|uniref:Thiol:disulfide interchange protein DsbD n=1 Tax=Novipirellula caenicola TaxID=1536901 RepID=A0ABP9VKA6_9BACT
MINRNGGGLLGLGCLLLAFVVGIPHVATAQSGFGNDGGVFSDFSLGGFGQDSGDPAKWEAKYFVEESGTQGRLEVIVDVDAGWHIYSVTQPAGGPMKTKLSIESPESVKLAGKFVPDEAPHKSVSEIFKGITIEEHGGRVVWSAPLVVPTDFRDPISIAVEAQVCKPDGACIPISETLTAAFAGNVAAAAAMTQADAESGNQAVEPAKTVATKPFRDDGYEVQWTAELTPATVAPGDRATLKLTAIPDAGFHVYQLTVDDADFSTNMVVSEKSGLLVGQPKASSVAVPVDVKLLPGVMFHKGTVTWSLPVQVPKDAEPGAHKIAGMIAYQACTDKSCQQPMALTFSTTLNVGSASGAGTSSAAVQFASVKRADVLDAAAETQWVDKLPTKPAPATQDTGDDTESQPTGDAVATGAATAADGEASLDDNAEDTAAHPATPVQPIVINDGDDSEGRPFAVVLMFAFLGGVILNFMPCVLPVVGLKVMSFVQQAGADRKRAFLLNFFYAAGIMSVFALLTALAVVFSLSWGEQFTYLPVRLGLTLLMFAMALSYLGVWEIPAPGMAGGKVSQDLQKREGYPGAFAKGAFATVLSTPCSGPFLGAIFGLTIALTAAETTALMMTIGLGMAIPYIMIGIWPKLVAWLPKPGNWMETLKEFLAFLFLATVAFFFNQFSDDHKVPVFVTLLGVWFGCWIIGKVPNWADIEKRLVAWVSGVAVATAIGMMAFQYLGAEPAPQEGVKTIAWEEYSEERLQELQAEGRTVMIDFTAKWCVNCIVNYNVALNTEETRKVIEELDAVPMLADWTDHNPEIKSKLAELQSRSIPVLAIYPGSNPNQPIVLRDLVSQSAVIDALRQAGASVDDPAIARSKKSPSKSTAFVH